MNKEIVYDMTPYFSNYTDIMDGIVYDLASFADAMVAGEQLEEIEKMKELSRLPIFRGYIEKENGKQYVNSYFYNGRIYLEKELSFALKDRSVPIMIESVGKNGELEVSPFEMGIEELFYYKNGPDGMEFYFEPNDVEEEQER